MRASDLIGRVAYDRDGNPIGNITELLMRPSARGSEGYVVYAAMITPGHTGRLLGYSRPGIQGPWLIERIAKWLNGGTREVPWADIRLDR